MELTKYTIKRLLFSSDIQEEYEQIIVFPSMLQLKFTKMELAQ